jgi:protein phosphatase
MHPPAEAVSPQPTLTEPLVYPYLWTVGVGAAEIPAGTVVAERYQVISPQVWCDLRPEWPPDAPQPMPTALLPYLRLSGRRHHLPSPYAVVTVDSHDLLLLENAPLEGAGSLLPTLAIALPQATHYRQLSWLLQLLELWPELEANGVAASLLDLDNLRIEGWRLRLRELQYLPGHPLTPASLEIAPTFDWQDLLPLLQRWLPLLHPSNQSVLEPVLRAFRLQPPTLADLRSVLETQLQRQLNPYPLQLTSASASVQGLAAAENRDRCFPLPQSAGGSRRWIAVLDGFGPYGGPAAQAAQRSLDLQLRGLMTSARRQQPALDPATLPSTLESMIRVTHGVLLERLASATTEPSGCTLALALQLPLAQADASETFHGLYLVTVGDSRLYWITNHYCQLLSIDDTQACQRVLQGKDFYRRAIAQAEGGTLIQALGVTPASELKPHVQRFWIQEDGILLACTDGLSDGGLIERYWAEDTAAVLRGDQPLQAWVDRWLERARRRRVDDDVTLSALLCRISVPIPSAPSTSSVWANPRGSLVAARPIDRPSSLRNRFGQWWSRLHRP